jgi:hypothetical protein
MAIEQFTFRLKGPDADNLIWLIYHGEARRGMVNLGELHDPKARQALALGSAGSAALAKELGHLAERPN